MATTTASTIIIVNISHISAELDTFDTLYAEGIVSTDLSKLQSNIEKMTHLQEAINIGLKRAAPPITRHFSWGVVAPLRTDNPLLLTQQIQEKLNEMIARFSHIDSQPVKPLSISAMFSKPIVNPNHTTSVAKPVVVVSQPQPRDFATGFHNLGANCWANSLLSMVLCVPSLKQAYDAVADYYTKHSDNRHKQYGEKLKQAFVEYDAALARKQPVAAQVTQDVRLAFNHFFGSHNPLINQEIFSKNKDVQEDTYEAMQMIVGRYEQILKEQNRFDPPPALYCQLETKRLYQAEGSAFEANPTKVSKGEYSQLRDDNSSAMSVTDYQILLDLHNKGHLSFPALLKDFFRSSSTEGSEPGTYLRNDGKLQKFKLTGETRQFTRVPDEFLLTIKRFGVSHLTGGTFKITAPVRINRIIALPSEALVNGARVAFELDAFIVHSGDISGGHYLNYKKINDRWLEVDNGGVRFVSDQEIDEILHGQKAATFTSYLHHYSRVPTARQTEAIATASTMLQRPVVSGVHELEIAKFVKEKQSCEQVLQELEKYASLCKTDTNSVALSKALEKLELSHPEVIKTFHHAIWLHEKTPTIDDYGKTASMLIPKNCKPFNSLGFILLAHCSNK